MDKHTYWNEDGKHQADWNALSAEMQKLEMDRTKFALPENAEWAVLNGMAGIYYGYFNDGDNVRAAINNNRVHGFTSLDDFLDVCRAVHAPVSLTQFLTARYNTPRTYEEAMDAAIVLAASKHLRKTPHVQHRHLCMQPTVGKKKRRIARK